MASDVLFVCVANSGRSQMAEAFFKKFAPEQLGAISAGIDPGGQINPNVVQVKAEIEMSGQKPKLILAPMIKESSRRVNMRCRDQEPCPSRFLKNIVDWNIPDPSGRSADKVRHIRDHAKDRVLNLISSFES